MILLVVWRYFFTRPVYQNGQHLRITARVSQEPVRYSFKQCLSLLGLKIYLPLFPEISYGDRVVVEGEVSGKELVNARLVSVAENRNWLYKFRERTVNFYRTTLPEPHASLVAGIVLGSKSQIPSNFWQELKNTGVAHVVVASGMNVTFVTSFLLAFLAIFLPRRQSVPLALSGVWFYAIFSGFDAPIIRAAIMATLAMGLQALGKVAASWRVIFLTALVMLALNPAWLTDTGFILTFTATASLMLFQKRVGDFFKFLPNFLGFIKEGLVTTLAAQIGVTPILFVTFGQFNIWSPLANAAVLWTVPLIMIIGAIGGIVGLFIPFLGKLILYLSYPLTWWFINIVSIF